MEITAKYYQQNPMQWIHDVLDDYPRWEKQIEILNSVRDYRRTYVKSAHGPGKSFTAKDVILWFLYNFYPATVITTAPSWQQVESILWAEINTAWKNAKYPLGGKCFDIKIDIKDNWFAIGLSPKIETADEGKRFTGFHNENILIVLDEAPSINEKVWEIINTLMTSVNVKLLAIGNPINDTGHFYNGFQSENVNKITMSLFDSPNFVANNIKFITDLIAINNLDLQEKEKLYNTFKNPYPSLTTVRWAVEMIKEWGIDSPMYMSRVLAKFPKKATDTILSLTELEACKTIETKDITKKILGVDVARFGSDDTCLIGYQNYLPIYKEKWNGLDTTKTANHIKNLIVKEKYEIIVVDVTGLGAGVVDPINEFIEFRPQVKLISINFAEGSNIPEYEGIITEMWYNAQKMIKEKIIQVEDEGNLFAELSNRKYKFTNKGKIKVEAKDDYKKRTGLSSPDEADAFILCMYGILLQNQGQSFASFGDMQTNKMEKEFN